MTLKELRDSLDRAAIENRQRGINCCAQLAEQTATRLTEAMRQENQS